MPVRFSAAQVQGLRQAQPVMGGATEAKARLQTMAAALVGSDGRVKSGYLKLVQGGQGSLQMGTRWSRSADASTQQATDMVKSLLREAYGDSPTVMSALETYLEASSQRLGTQSFVKLVQRLADASAEPGAPAVLASARPRDTARLDGDRVATGYKLDRWAQEERRLSQGLNAATSAQDKVLLRLQLQQGLTDLQALRETDPEAGARIAGLVQQVQRAVLPAVAGLPADAMQGSVALRGLLDHAASSSVSEADRLAVLSALDEGQRTELMDYFDSAAMDRDLAALALHEAQEPGSGAGAALIELRACDAALRALVAGPPRAEQAPLALPPGVLQPVQAKFEDLLSAWQSGRGHECVALLEAFAEQMNETLPHLAQLQHVQLKGADEKAQTRSQLLTGLMASLSDAQVAHAVQMMQQLGVMNLLALGSDVLGKMGSSGYLSQHRQLAGTHERLNGRMVAMEAHTAMLDAALSVRLRGHAQIGAPSAMSTVPHELLAVSAETKAHFWRAYPQEPLLSLAEFEATQARSTMQPTDPALVSQWQLETFRSGWIKHALDRLGPLSDLDTARMVQLFMHPASRHPRLGDKFIYLLGASAPALLQLSQQLGQVPSDAQIWQTVLGEQAPDDLQGRGAADLSTRMEQQARQIYGAAARAAHLASGGNESSLAVWLKNDPLMKGLIQGFSLRRQIECMQHPDRPVTERDFFPEQMQPVMGKHKADTAFGQTKDIHRWMSPTRFIFDDAEALDGQSVMDPNAQPWVGEGEPPVNHPVIEDLRARVAALTGGRPEQSQAVLTALTQVSTVLLTVAAMAAPWDVVTKQIEHGAYDFRLGVGADGTVQIRISANPGMRFLGELDLDVSPEGQVQTTGLRLWPRLALPEQWPQFQGLLQDAQRRLNDPSDEDPGASLARVRALCDQLAKELPRLTAPSQAPSQALEPAPEPALQAVVQEASEALADAQWDLANALITRNAQPDDPEAEQSGPDLMELGQARRLLEAVMAHAQATENEALLYQAKEEYDAHFSVQPVSVEELSEEALERGSLGSMIRARAASLRSSGADDLAPE